MTNVTQTEKPKAKRKRIVFGRVRFSPPDGKRIVFELTKAGLQFRALHSRNRKQLLSFVEILSLAKGQLNFTFQK